MGSVNNSARWVLLFTRCITEAFYSCFTGKFFAKAAPGRKLARDQWPIRIRGAQCSVGKDGIPWLPFVRRFGEKRANAVLDHCSGL